MRRVGLQTENKGHKADARLTMALMLSQSYVGGCHATSVTD